MQIILATSPSNIAESESTLDDAGVDLYADVNALFEVTPTGASIDSFELEVLKEGNLVTLSDNPFSLDGHMLKRAQVSNEAIYVGDYSVSVTALNAAKTISAKHTVSYTIHAAADPCLGTVVLADTI